MRKLTESTILGHFAKLIEAGQVKLTDILPADKIEVLTAAFEGFEAESLSTLKEKHGYAFTFAELKLFRAGMAAKE